LFAREASLWGKQWEVARSAAAAASLAAKIGAFEHLWYACAAEGARCAAIGWVNGLVLLKFCEQCVEGFKKVHRGVCVEVDDGREGEAEEEVLCGTAGLVARGKGREAVKVVFGEEERVEPVDAAFVAGRESQYGELRTD
jgi:hypothetical protein